MVAIAYVDTADLPLLQRGACDGSFFDHVLSIHRKRSTAVGPVAAVILVRTGRRHDAPGNEVGKSAAKQGAHFVGRREPGNPLNLLSYFRYLKYRFKIENSNETALLSRLSGRDQQVTLATLGR